MFLTFLLVWLSTFRVTRFVVKDTIIQGQREWFYRHFPPSPEWTGWYSGRVAGRKVWRMDDKPRRKVSKIGEMVSCAWCIGFWISGLVVLAVAQCTPMPLPFLWWPATSAAVGLTFKRLDG